MFEFRLHVLDVGGDLETLAVGRDILLQAGDFRLRIVDARIEIGQRGVELGLALLKDRLLQQLVAVAVGRAVVAMGVLGLEPRDQGLGTRLLLLILRQVGAGEGRIERGQHLALLHHVAHLDRDGPDDGLVERLHVERALGRDHLAVGRDDASSFVTEASASATTIIAMMT